MIGRLVIATLLGGILAALLWPDREGECERFGRMAHVPVIQDGRCFAVTGNEVIPTEELVQKLRAQNTRPKVVM